MRSRKWRRLSEFSRDGSDSAQACSPRRSLYAGFTYSVGLPSEVSATRRSTCSTMKNVESQATLQIAVDRLNSVRREIAKIIVGQDDVVEGVLICLLASGHVLLEGVPGLGKTTLLRTLARTLQLKYSRIQFTPALIPADIVGSMIMETDERGGKGLRFQPGP